MFLKFILRILGGLSFIYFFVQLSIRVCIFKIKEIVAPLRHSSRYLRREILSIPNCKKLLECNPGIKIIEGSFFGQPAWVALRKVKKSGKGKILTTIEVVNQDLSKGKDTVLFTLAHEIGHIKDTAFSDPDIPDCYGEMGCIAREWVAWEEGSEILGQAGIEIDPQKYWQYALVKLTTFYDDEGLSCFLECPLRKEVENLIKDLETSIPITIPKILKTF